MNLSEFIKLLESGARPVVEFAAGIDDKESFAEKGMRARVLGMRREDSEVVQIDFDFSEFESLNLPLQSTNYYDKQGVPCLTAVQAGFYKPQEPMYFDIGESLDRLLNLVSDGQSALFAQFKDATAATPMMYVAWLEQELTKARANSAG